jgi:hypothetical protein
MKAIRLIQLIWAATLVAILAALSLNAPTVKGLPFLVLAAVYLFACIRAWGSSRAAWVVALVAPVVICARWLPMVLLNVVAFVRDDPLYLDSPATIFIVAIDALVLVVPSLVLIALFWRQRTALQALFIARGPGAA